MTNYSETIGKYRKVITTGKRKIKRNISFLVFIYTVYTKRMWKANVACR